MKKKDLVRTLVITLGYVMIFMAVDYKINGLLVKYALVMLVTGAAILIYEEFVFKGKDNNFRIGWPAILRTFAYILLFLGLKSYLVKYVATSWVWFLVVGFLIYNYHDKIVNKLVPGSNNNNEKNFGGGLI